MATLSLLDRERTRTRDRPRPSAPGNFITNARFATVFSLTFAPTPQHYIKWWPYAFPSTKAIGYKDDPPIVPQWIPVGPVDNPSTILNIAESLIPGAPGAAIAPIIVPPSDLPLPLPETIFNPFPIGTFQVLTPPTLPANVIPGSTVTTQTAHKAGMTFSTLIGLAAKQIFGTQWPIRMVTILADPANGGRVWIGYDSQVIPGNGFPLIAGAAKDLNIDDLSNVWLIADAAGQLIHVEYTR